MKLPWVVVGIAVGFAGVSAEAKLPPLRDPVFLNIGFVCQWQQRCMDRQQRAMKRALSYTKRSNPPSWKVHVCNRRAVQRRSGRVDWVSYYNCIRNPDVERAAAMRSGRETGR